MCRWHARSPGSPRACPPPEGGGRRRVRHHRAALELDARDRVDAARHQRRQVRQVRTERRVRAGVLQRLEPVGEHLAVLRPADGEVEALRASVWERDHALAARLGPAHRPAELACKPDDQQLLHVERLRAEPPADVWSDDPDLFRLEAERLGDPHPVLVRRLRRQPGGEAPVGPELGGARPRLERARCHALAVDRARHDDVAVVEQSLVVVGRAGTGRHVRPGFREEQRLVCCGVLPRDDTRQWLVVDQDELGGVRAGRAVVADHDRDDVAHEANDVLGDERPPHGLVQTGERRRPVRRQVEIGMGQDAHVRESFGGRGVEFADPSVREQGADERDRRGPVEGQVLHVAPLAAEEARVLLPQHTIPEDAQRERAYSRAGDSTTANCGATSRSGGNP